MAKKYGLPYQGSKSKLAERIVALLPPATHLYDVFAGGCAITHAALLSGKFKEVHANDITDSVTLFEDALNGKYENESRWISREDFFRLKDSDPYVRIVWSFGNNQQAYLYSKEIEPYKKAVHEMLYAATPNERRLKFKAVIREMEKLGLISNNMPKYMSDRVDMQQGCIQGGGETKDWLGQYERLQSTERAEQIKAIRLTDFEHNERTGKIAALGSIQLSENRGGGDNSMSAKLTTIIGDYRNVEILPDSIIYCDPPYKSTCGYGIEFDHEAFYDWCEKQTALVLISEYWMPEDRFVCIAEFERKSTFSATNNSLSRIEKVFVPKGQLEMYKRIMNK